VCLFSNSKKLLLFVGSEISSIRFGSGFALTADAILFF
jgi:hypothetical protein